MEENGIYLTCTKGRLHKNRMGAWVQYLILAKIYNFCDNFPSVLTDNRRGQESGTITSVRRFGQGPSYIPKRLTSWS